MLSNESLNEFKKIMLEDYGLTLSDEQAYQDAIAFLDGFKLLVPNNSLILKDSIDVARKGYG